MTEPDTARAAAPTPAEPRLGLRGLSRRFGAVAALDDVTLSVHAGEIVALLGPSGCGKSTLLRVVAGLERPDAGRMRLDGREVGADVPPEARGIGLMFQDYALFPHLSVIENVRFGLHCRRDAAETARRRLEQVGLAHRADAYPATLSGGESQRVALARALAPGPRVLLLDEPFSNLDPDTRERVRADTLAVLAQTGITAILVTHDAQEALVFSDRVVLMRAGRIVQAGRGEDLYRRPACAFAARAFGTLLEFDGVARSGRVETPFGPLAAPGLAEGARARVCLRAGALRAARDGGGAPARVLRRSFAGPDARLVLAVEGFSESASLLVGHDDPHREGETVRLSLSGCEAFAFPAEAE